MALIKHQRYGRAKHFKRANMAQRKPKAYFGGVVRDIARQIAGEEELEAMFCWPLYQGSAVLENVRANAAARSAPRARSAASEGKAMPPASSSSRRRAASTHRRCPQPLWRPKVRNGHPAVWKRQPATRYSASSPTGDRATTPTHP
ncbi:hypothetical protein [Mesorhizobium sp. WSM3868]|uniref:hypothetical protein n=1 Tax=Mesorhizobium sp. WSM3868 TaxID=2029405 RepID=UPI0011816BF9|nr:hypothetical protein [Mesorhizobium sp. WSM3868]